MTIEGGCECVCIWKEKSGVLSTARYLIKKKMGERKLQKADVDPLTEGR